MSGENYYEYNGEIDLDAQTLFDYISQQNEVEKRINDVVPANPLIFGQAMEPFESNNKYKSQSSTNVNGTEKTFQEDLQQSKFYVNENSRKEKYFKWIIFILLALLALYFLSNLNFSQCRNKYKENLGLNEKIIDTMTPVVESDFRAIFVR